MRWVNRALALLLLAATTAATVLFARNKQAKAERSQAQQRADIAETVNDTNARINKKRNELKQKHESENNIEEQRDENAPRDQLDNNW